jgi:hypothetical protein
MCTGTHPYINVNDTIEVRLQYLTPGGVAENVLDFTKSSTVLDGDMEDMANAVKDAWEAHVGNATSEDITLTSVIATDVSSETGGGFEAIAGISGGFLQPALPGNATIAVSYKTAKRGRSYRGRTYHVGLPKTWQSGDTIGPTNATTLQEIYQAFYDAIATDMPDFVHTVVSRCQANAWLLVAETTPVTAIVVEPTIDSQRRRLAGRGI